MMLATSKFLISSARNTFIRSPFVLTRRRLMHSETGKCSVNNVDLFYEKTGNNASQVLLCVPGALGTTRTDFGPQLDQLKENFTVVSFDPRGYGKSIPPERDFPLDFYHRDAEDGAALMKELGYAKYSVLGWSDGGISGLILAGKYPNLLDSLVVWGANATATDKDIEIYEVIRDMSKWSAKMREPLEALYRENVQKLWGGWIDGVTSISKTNNGNLCTEYLPKIKCPTLIIHGAKDPLVPSFHPEYNHKHIKGSVLHIMAEGKHNIHLRYAEEFNKLVTDFCKNK